MIRATVTIALAVSYSAYLATTLAAPSASPTPKTWELNFTFLDPQRISVRLPGAASDETYWYIMFQVANSTGQDVEFFPSFRLVTDTLDVLEGGADIHPRVYDAILERHKSDFPFAQPPSKITGPLLQGEDNARSSTIVFREFDSKADQFTIYVAGLSGDLEAVSNPTFDPKAADSDANPRVYVLRRTLAIRYDFPGDPDSRRSAIPARRSRAWVLR